MADGSPSTSRKRTMLSYAEETDPRFVDRAAASFHGDHGGGHGGHADHKRAHSGHGGHALHPPRVAFTGEEFGFGYEAAAKFIAEGRRRLIYDGGLRVAKVRTEQEFRSKADGYDGDNDKYDFKSSITQPLRTKEQALLAVKQHTADFAVVPFYNPYFGYDYETLRALGSLFFLMGVEQIEATDHYCLAVHESQLYDLIQSAHPGTGFSALQRRFRKSWGTVDFGSGNGPGNDYDAEMPRAGLPIDMADQKLIRDRIDLVFAGPEAARRCKSKLDGVRAIGLEVQEIPEMVEPHRELARRARSTANSTRQTNTMFDPISGETRFVSTLGAESQGGRLYGMVLPYGVAMRSSDYVIIDHNFEDGVAPKTRFLVVEANPDHTLVEDAYRTTDAKTRYWYRRLSAVAKATSSFSTQAMRIVGGFGILGGAALAALGVMGVYSSSIPFLTDNFRAVFTPMTSQMAMAGGALIIALSWLLAQAQGGAVQGVRVLFRFLRNSSAASISEVENFLRNHAVRHSVVRTDEDSEGHEPAPIVLDVEFEAADFGYNPFTILSGRRLQGSVVNGALKKALQRWKSRGVVVIAAMPVIGNAFQLPKPKPRRWWAEAVRAWAADFTETMQIRMIRLAPLLLLIAALAFIIWQWRIGALG